MLDALLSHPVAGSLLTRLVVLADEVVEGPEPEDVKAGWGAFALFILGIAAVVLLSFSLVKQLRRAQQARDAGVYGDVPTDRGGPADGSPEGPAAGPAGSGRTPRGEGPDLRD
ncbi:hypothetical protein [Nocardioides perillae]|uniref:Uncharacterized protein n=1 Tax=Nocardioides perillae TaxID=1119534 RepID=A0A7Y9RWV2_9ACTN|nr:hypothetical protein [Nocardioides perillae]NYG56779.1 hypothetical protein [Nocardioides perillae]